VGAQAFSDWAIRIRPATPGRVRWLAWAVALAAAGCLALAAYRGAGLAPAAALCAAGCLAAILARRARRAAPKVLELRASTAGAWQLRDTAGWHEARLARVWRCRAWLTARFLCRTGGQAEHARVVTFWRCRVAPDVWRRLNGLVAWHLGRPAPVRGPA